MAIKKVLKSVKRISGNTFYLNSLKKPIDESVILLEAGQGKHINGNVFALLKIIESDEKYSNLNPYLVIEEKIRQTAKLKIKKYNFDKTRLIVRGSKEYKRILATAKYLVTDNSFPYYFNKRKAQVYLNTWHGTPLKRLGRADIRNSASIGNVQKNFLSADYLLFPNEYTRNTMMSDYMIDRCYEGKTVVIDYPRNDALFDENIKKEIVQRYNLDGKRVIAYMPTWRGQGRNADVKKQYDDAEKILEIIDDKLKENEILYVNFHFLLGDKLDFNKYKKIRKFPSEYETYDFLGVCDTLISDYSSVMLDFAQTGKNIIMFIYDYEQYNEEKGFYFDIKTLPFIKTYDVMQLIDAVHKEKKDYMLPNEFIGTEFGNASNCILDIITGDGRQELVKINKGLDGLNIVHFGNITLEENTFMLHKYIDCLTEKERKSTIISFENSIDSKTSEILESIDSNIQYLRIVPNKLKSYKDYFKTNLSKLLHRNTKSARKYYSREWKRMFCNLNPDTMQMFLSDDFEMYDIVAAYSGKTIINKIPYSFLNINGVKVSECPKVERKYLKEYDEIISYDNEYGKEFWDEDKECNGISARLYKAKYRVTEKTIRIDGRIITKYPGYFADAEGSVILGDDKKYDCVIKETKRYITEGICTILYDFSVTFTTEELSKWNVHNDLYVYVNIAGNRYKTLLLTAKYKNYFKKITYYNETYNYICVFKERYKNYRITVRAKNVTDRRLEKIKIFLAWICSIITYKYKPALIYEKNCARYEESGSVVFEQMIDMGSNNTRFILDNNYPYVDRIQDKYKKYIVDRFSFKHYYNLFAAKTLISSEAIAHSLEVRNNSRLFRYFVKNGLKNYVFLQHGVMYMVSLDAEQRIFFNKSENRGKQRIVVSSELEAQHFLDYTDYKREDIYVSGLPKFDKSVLDESADKIVIMPTWRPWEFVKGLSNFKDTGYYKMTERIVNCVPESLKEKLIVLPHPLIQQQIERDDSNTIWEYYKNYKDFKYDDILKQTRLLITDYSSISYDAYYRGANVIFYWGEKDECMMHYGKSAHLMLDDSLAFGEICYGYKHLSTSIEKVYNKEQDDNQLMNYRKIVEFKDGKNTSRLIEKMVSDGLV